MDFTTKIVVCFTHGCFFRGGLTFSTRGTFATLHAREACEGARAAQHRCEISRISTVNALWCAQRTATPLTASAVIRSKK